MKRKVMIAIVAVLLAALIVGGTIAVLNYTARTRNVITTGGVHIQLVETDGEDNAPFKDLVDVYPGATAGKNIRLQNVGAQSAWVRIKIEKNIELADGVTGQPDISLVTLTVEPAEGSGWEYSDGYWYFKNELSGYSQTEVPLPVDIKFSEDMGPMYAKSKIRVIVTAEATQVKNNPAENALLASGWPE